MIADPGPDDPRETRVICYYALLDAIESLPTPAARLSQFRSLLDYMLARGELVYGAGLAARPTDSRRFRVLRRCYRTLGRRGRWAVPAAEYDALAATARALEQLDKRGAVCLDGQEGRLRYGLTEESESIFLMRPELRPKRRRPRRRGVRLLSASDYPDVRAISRVQVRGGRVDHGPGRRGAARGGADRREADAHEKRQVSRPTAGQHPAAPGTAAPLRLPATDCRGLGQRATPPCPRGAIPATRLAPPFCPTRTIAISTWTSATLCIGSFSQGLCLVPLQGGAAEWLEYDGQEPPDRRVPTRENVIHHFQDVPDDERLPSGRVLSLAVQDGKAFASVGAFSRQGSFLVSVRLDDHKVRIISSSRGAKQQTPLDGLAEPALVLLPLVKDPVRRRLLFVVSHPLSHSGLWELDAQTEKIRRLMACEHYIHWISGNRAGRVLLALANVDRSTWYAIEYDLVHDRAELIYSGQAAAAIDGLKPGKRAIVVPGWPAQPPYLRVGDAMWTGSPFGRVERGGAGGVVFPPLEDKLELLRELVGLEHEFNWRTMEPLEDGRILVADRHGVWLVTP